MSQTFLQSVRNGDWIKANSSSLSLPKKDSTKTLVCACGLAVANPIPELHIIKTLFRRTPKEGRLQALRQMKMVFHAGCGRDISSFLTRVQGSFEEVEREITECHENLLKALEDFPRDGSSDDFEAAFEHYYEEWGYTYDEFKKDCRSSDYVMHLVLGAMVYKDMLRDDAISVNFIEKELKKDEVIKKLKEHMLAFADKLYLHGFGRQASEDLDFSKATVFQKSKICPHPHSVLKDKYFQRLYVVERDSIIERSKKDLENEGDTVSDPKLMCMPELVELLCKAEAGEFLRKVPSIDMVLDMIDLSSILIQQVREKEREVEEEYECPAV